ncbi:tRNA (adenosine(37)-N6)-threonylcarbamoyltransferase complex ATPase subunit type 1 TsaE [Kordiimonas sediminis]|uniref:tRNA threonylcarbamoyladenosine biosynthesis protein TsaE n=1 Tax=Kordiimonas sediminis TaxID=1735581 RepID=A0A919E5Q8_9PROT|nr:tRNA (adenosine(37)-N6)-threonylcarbamoyltransferase complex ATPase subunit type 1 TsaE [Kordiimonas sediminis]GHF16685.1 tRNA (adenosine(37)-N6)-threonylcarbamoyltransferase complex ATPase subunit type 1 TsaE [Kordiimonas sediminis]
MAHDEIVACENLTERDMTAIAAQLAQYVRAGDMVLLSGDLGMGKSTFARALIRALLDDPGADVPSPTFTIVQSYPLEDGTEIWHTDLYRLSGPEDVYDLGFDDVLDDTLFLVEWPDRLPEDMQDTALQIRFSAPTPDDRTVSFCGNADWQERLRGASLS